MSFDVEIIRFSRPLLHTEYRGHDTLLICAGDSWTWGDSLGQIGKTGNRLTDDFNWRINHIYGTLMSKKLNTDFINYGVPGGSNIQIIDSVCLKILPQVIEDYKRIIVVFTLTELAREICDDGLWAKEIKSSTSLSNFLQQYEANMFETLKGYQQHFPEVCWMIARNFTYSFAENQSSIKGHLTKTWIDQLAKSIGDDSYPKTLRILSDQGHNPLVRYLKREKIFTEFKEAYLELLLHGLDAIAWLDESPLNYKYATRHPTERAHELWCDYLVSEYSRLYLA